MAFGRTRRGLNWDPPSRPTLLGSPSDETYLPPQLVPFIRPDDHGKLFVCPEASRLLADVTAPIVVCAVGGSYRGGKDFLVNLFAGVKDPGFAIGPASLHDTKGIWIWVKPLPVPSDGAILVMDVERLDGLNKEEPELDNYLMLIAMLLCAEFVWSTANSPSKDSMEHLRFLDELPRFVVLPDYSPPPPVFVDRFGEGSPLPGFSVALWDFRPQPNSSNDVLDRGLRTRREGTEDFTRDFNRRRELFSAHFPVGRRHCFGLPIPVQPDRLPDSERLAESQVEVALHYAVSSLAHHVLQANTTKRVQGAALSGSLFTMLAEQLCEFQRAGSPLCIESATAVVCDVHNSAVCLEAVELYRRRMATAMRRLPLLITQVDERHAKAVGEALEAFASRRVLDKDGVHAMRLVDLIAVARREIVQEADEASGKRCRQRLVELYAGVKRKNEQEAFSTPGGHAVYQSLMDDLVLQYCETPGLGDEMDRILSLFLNEKAEDGRVIFIVDKIVTAMEEEKRKKAVEEREMAERQRRLEEKSREQELHISNLRHKLESLESYALECGWTYSREPKRGRDREVCSIL
ncbi:guanylate-binding protein 6-like [Petromyzon marinus]|uniref:Guanylate-binding protein 2-like n=1 Tax=Petromyzon marinus TaxID=7757 RepID=A0AAJ7XHH0_PETMA|nr:guanylate-binding protein 2-like [Petromyzon marinus]